MQEPSPAETTLADLIDQLVVPPPPEPISLWPQTAGAWTLCALLLGIALYFAWRLWRRYQANAYRREALAQLAHPTTDPAQIAEIVRRTALAAYPRTEVASLTANDWLDFLNHRTPRPLFVDAVAQTLLAAPYRPGRIDDERVTALHRAASDWVRQHRPMTPPARRKGHRPPAKEELAP